MEIDAGLRHHLDGGGGALFVTFTLRHHRSDTLSSRLDVISQALRWTLCGTPWYRRRDALGYVGAIKSVEITHGVNGWHAHCHAVLLFDRPGTESEHRDLESWIFGRWLKVATRRGLGTVTREHGVDVRPITLNDDGRSLGEYLTKIDGGWTPGLELARTDLKARSRTPFDLLRDVCETGEKRAAALWIEYEQATFGKRAIVWSPGLRRRLLGVDQEPTDVELAAGEGLDLALIRALVPAGVWDATVRDATTGRLLTDIEHGAALLIWMADTIGHDLQPLDLPEAIE